MRLHKPTFENNLDIFCASILVTFVTHRQTTLSYLEVALLLTRVRTFIKNQNTIF